MKRSVLSILAFLLCIPSFAQKGEKKGVSPRELSFINNYTLPHTLVKAKTNVKGKAFSVESILTDSPIKTQSKENKILHSDAQGWFLLPISSKKGNKEITTLSFTMSNEGFVKGKLEIYANVKLALFNGEKSVASSFKVPDSDTIASISLTQSFRAGGHTFYLRTLSEVNGEISPKIKLRFTPDSDSKNSEFTFSKKDKQPLSIDYMMSGENLLSVRVSPSGKYAIVIYSRTKNLKTERFARLYNQKGKLLRENEELVSANWLKDKDCLYWVEDVSGESILYTQDPNGGDRNVLVRGLPKGGVKFAPDMKSIYITQVDQADKKDVQVQRMKDPNDRIAGWRNGATILQMDIATGVVAPIVYGKGGLALVDVAKDGNLLLLESETDWKKQPYTFSTLYNYNPKTGVIDTLFRKERDITQARYLGGRTGKILLISSPNAFGGIGKVLPKNQLANDFEHELFILNRKTKDVRCLTKNFDPSIDYFQFDYKGNVMLQVTEGPDKLYYALDLKSEVIKPLPLQEQYVARASFASKSDVWWYLGQSVANADRLYSVNNGKTSLIWDLDKEKMANYLRPEVKDFVYKAEDGTDIEGWYYLPPHFDESKKYPLLVYYYGGTLPSRHRMEGSYSPAMYAAQGYVVYLLNPSGCTGYGQEFSARHLNAWGDRTAAEIISAIRSFCDQHKFVNSKKIGCFGASYGGFMTQYLVTQTDLFAAAISHAGISNITNYWGSGYWGLGYNTVASAGSYPWSRKGLFVDHSPIFNADKIHTPLLLLHGDSDTNVPTAESINLYNALKVLGREVELVTFTGQDHFILEPERRIRWSELQFAWFARFLKDDPQWWYELYPKEE